MSAGMLFVLWKGLLGFVLPIAVGLWELRQLRRYRDEDAAAAAPPRAAVPFEGRPAALAMADKREAAAKVLEPA
jgi:hypothetical protein